MPPFIVTVPVSGRTLFAPRASVPPVIVVPPVKVLDADSVTVPLPVFTIAPVPARIAETVPSCRS